jgi:hypothetical protein
MHERDPLSASRGNCNNQSWLSPCAVGVRRRARARERATAKFVLSDPSERAEKLTLSLQRYYFYVLFGEREIKYRVALSPPSPPRSE